MTNDDVAEELARQDWAQIQDHMNGDPGRLLLPAEVAALFRVDPKTVGRWAKQGKLTCVTTPGGHRRYYETEVRRLAAGRSGNSS